MTDVRIRRRRPLVSILAIILGIWAILLILNGILLLLTSWWTSYGSDYEIFGLTGALAGIVTLIVGLIYLGLTIGLWRVRFWAWIIAFIVTIGWVVDAAYSLSSSSPRWGGLIVSILLLIYIFLVRRDFRGTVVQT